MPVSLSKLTAARRTEEHAHSVRSNSNLDRQTRGQSSAARAPAPAQLVSMAIIACVISIGHCHCGAAAVPGDSHCGGYAPTSGPCQELAAFCALCSFQQLCASNTQSNPRSSSQQREEELRQLSIAKLSQILAMGNCLSGLFGRKSRRGYISAVDGDSDDDEASARPLMADEEGPQVRREQRNDDDDEEGATKKEEKNEEEKEADGDEALLGDDPLSDAALRQNVASLMPDLDPPVPTNTPADQNLLDL